MRLLLLLVLFTSSCRGVVFHSQCDWIGTTRTVTQSVGNWTGMTASVSGLVSGDVVELYLERDMTGTKFTITRDEGCLATYSEWNCPECCPCTWDKDAKSIRVSSTTVTTSSHPRTTRRPWTSTSSTDPRTRFTRTTLEMLGNSTFSKTILALTSSAKKEGEGKSRFTLPIPVYVGVGVAIFVIVVPLLIIAVRKARRKRAETSVIEYPTVYNLDSSGVDSDFPKMYGDYANYPTDTGKEDYANYPTDTTDRGKGDYSTDATTDTDYRTTDEYANYPTTTDEYDSAEDEYVEYVPKDDECIKMAGDE